MIETLGQKVKRERERRKWSQECLANLADTTAPTISRIESDIHYPRRKTLKKIANAFEKPTTYFSPTERDLKSTNNNVLPFHPHNPKYQRALEILDLIFKTGKEKLINHAVNFLEEYLALIEPEPSPKKKPGKL